MPFQIPTPLLSVHPQVAFHHKLALSLSHCFPALSCEFASVDVNDVLGTNRLNITKEIRKYGIDQNLQRTRSGFEPGPYLRVIKHDAEIDAEYTEGAISLNARNFDRASHLYPILVVNFFAPWCSWSKRLVLFITGCLGNFFPK